MATGCKSVADCEHTPKSQETCCSELLDLACNAQGVVLGQLLTLHSLVVKLTVVRLCVPVCATKELVTLALEASQANLQDEQQEDGLMFLASCSSYRNVVCFTNPGNYFPVVKYGCEMQDCHVTSVVCNNSSSALDQKNPIQVKMIYGKNVEQNRAGLVIGITSCVSVWTWLTRAESQGARPRVIEIYRGTPQLVLGNAIKQVCIDGNSYLPACDRRRGSSETGLQVVEVLMHRWLHPRLLMSLM